MSTLGLTTTATISSPEASKGHKLRVALCALAAMAVTAAILYYGMGYYLSSPMDRPYHPRHAMLRPGGLIGLSLGVFGVFLFLLIFIYPLRKRWKWLGKIGNSRHWLDFHIVLGLTAPVVIALHASFKFSGIAGMAYWIMFAVALSGIAGRYIYAQIPRSMNSAEVNLQELKQRQESLTAQLSAQNVVRPNDLAVLFRLPSPKYVERESLLRALGALLWIDFKRPFRVARVRRRALGFFGKVVTLAGFVSSRNYKLEHIIAVARDQARLSKKLLFLAKSQRILHLWHVVHRPFSYSFAVLALVHIAIASLFGLMR
ncbi:MAG: hypothetical protein LAO20_07505 [Acidobacteriia bacterium]|nr:hypothetical protein [Terriglobia bacterium]